jgi:putative membrane protein
MMTGKAHAYGTGMLVLAMTVGISAQNAGPQTASPGAPRSEAQAGQSDAKGFIDELTIAGMTEVQLGKLAVERGSHPAVKEFGQMMVRDHTAAGQELAQVAAQLRIQPPAQLDEKHRALVERISQRSGAEFDREYAAAMVEGHQEVVAKLRARTGNRMTSAQPGAPEQPVTGAAGAAQSQNARSGAPESGSGAASGAASAVGTSGAAGGADGNDAVTQWAAKTLPTVQQHLDKARDLQQKTK